MSQHSNHDDECLSRPRDAARRTELAMTADEYLEYAAAFPAPTPDEFEIVDRLNSQLCEV